MAGNVISNTARIIPFLIFPLITALGFKYIIGRIHESGLASKLHSHCGTPLEGYSDWLSATNFVLPYTGITALDKSFACGYVVFFHAVMDSPKSLPAIEYFVATGAPYALVTVVEGNRKGQNRLLRFPVVHLLLTQIASFGATFPMSCLILVISGGVERTRKFSARSFTRVQAESIAFAMIMGGVVPSLAMFIFDQPLVTWAWQLYPIYISVFQNLYLHLRSPSRSAASGYSIMRALYITTFLVSALTHLTVVWKRRNDLTSVIRLLLPSTEILHPSIDIDLQTLYALNWDYTLGYIAACIALLWYARSWQQIITILTWYALATPLFGLGTAFMGVAMWRDGILWRLEVLELRTSLSIFWQSDAQIGIAATPEDDFGRRIITMLPSSPQVQTVYSSGIIPILQKLHSDPAESTLCIDSTTLDVSVAREVAANVTATGAKMIDAPVSGGVAGAKAATLSFLVGGKEESFTLAQPILSFMGQRIIHCGPSGAGLAAKICNNLVLGVQQIVVAEAMLLGQSLGLDPAVLASVVNSSTGACWASLVNNPTPSALPDKSPPCERDYEGEFATLLMLKDMGLASDVARQSRTPLPLGEAAREIYSTVVEKQRELAKTDFSSVYRFLQGQQR